MSELLASISSEDSAIGRGVLDRYQGQRDSNLVRHGRGRYVFDNRFFAFEGEYCCGRKDGPGVFVMKDGTIIEGDFSGGELTGKGRKTWNDESRVVERYDGEFQDGELSGKGILHFRNGAVYKGNFRRNTMEGSGLLVDPNLGTYLGEFHSGRREGMGDQSYENCPDKFRYRGQWAHNQYHGPGELSLDGQIIANCQFSRGVPIQKPTRIKLDKTDYKFQRGQPLEMNLKILDQNGEPVKGMYFMKVELTVWYKKPDIPNRLKSDEEVAELAGRIEAEDSPYYEVVQFPVTSFENATLDASIKSNYVRGVLNDLADSPDDSLNEAATALLNSSANEVDTWPPHPLECVSVDGEGKASFHRFGLPAAQNHGYAPFLLESLVKSKRRHSVTRQVVGESPVVRRRHSLCVQPGMNLLDRSGAKNAEDKGGLATIEQGEKKYLDEDFKKMSAPEIVNVLLAQLGTRAGDYVIKIEDVTSQLFYDWLKLVRMEPCYTKITIHEYRKPRKHRKSDQSRDPTAHLEAAAEDA